MDQVVRSRLGRSRAAVWVLRVCVCAAAAALWTHRADVDDWIWARYARVTAMASSLAHESEARASAMAARVFLHDSFEPALATLSFLVILAGYYVVDNMVPTWATAPLRIHPSKLGNQSWVVESTGRAQELAAYIVPLAVFDMLWPRRVSRVLAAGPPPSVAVLIGQIVGCLVVYDALFYLAHRVMHAVPRLYAVTHAKHHTRRLQRAIETVRLTLVEQAVDVGCSIAAVNLTGAHPLARAFYVPLIVLLLCDLHSGYDVPWSPENLVPGALWGGAVHHDLHHRNGRYNFAKFSTLWDRLFGTYKS